LSHYLAKSKYSTMQLYSTANSVQSDAMTFTCSNVQEGCYFFEYTD